MPNNMQRSSTANILRELGPYMNVGTQTSVTVLAFVFVGWYLDEQNASSPLWIGILGGVGAVVGLVNLIRSLNSISKRNMERTAVNTTTSNEEN